MTAEEQKAQEDALLVKIKEQNKTQIDEFKSEFTKLMNDSKSGVITEEVFNEKTNALTEKLKDFDPEGYKKFTETLSGYEEKLKAQGTELKKLQEGGGAGVKKPSFKDELKKALETEEYKSFAEGKSKKVSFPIKAAVSITNDYTGPTQHHITNRDSRVVDHPSINRLNIRDLLTTMPADLPYLAFMEVYDWDNKVTMNSENGMLTESSFKMREATVDVKRMGTHVPLSKRMLRSVSFILAHLMQKLPAMVRFIEDFQFLWGDGEGENVKGIFKVARDFTDLINQSIAGAAGDVASIESYDAGTKTIVNFTANQLIQNGDTLTIAGAPAAYNGTHKAILISDKQVLIDVAYAAGATAAWTYTVSSPFKDSIAAAQQIDVLKVSKTLVTVQEYNATGFVLNPVDATLIETLKGNDEHYLDVKRLENGILTIAGVPVVETTAIPAGKFAVGDWAMAAAIGQFTQLTLEFSESTQEKLTNTVEAIIQEEILFPIYNKYMFVTGDFSTAVNAISQ